MTLEVSDRVELPLSHVGQILLVLRRNLTKVWQRRNHQREDTTRRALSALWCETPFLFQK
jgi:hypothetical protein